MRLADLPAGNVFGYHPVVGGPPSVAVKVRQVGVPEICQVVEIDSYTVMADDLEVDPLCLVEEYDAGIGRVRPPKRQQLKTVQKGTVCLTGFPFGLVQSVIAVDAVTISGRIVAFMGNPQGFDAEMEVEDKGYAGDYCEWEEKRVRICPNCERVTLMEVDEQIPGFAWVGVCLNCKAKVAISVK